MMKKIINYSFVGFLMFNTSCHAISTNFVARGFKSCTDRCTGIVDCQKYYQWCKDNCVYDSKTNLKNILKGIKSCETKSTIPQAPSKSQSGSTSAPNKSVTTENNRNKNSSSSNYNDKETESTPTSAPSKADTLQKYTENYNNKTPSSTPSGSKEAQSVPTAAPSENQSNSVSAPNKSVTTENNRNKNSSSSNYDDKRTESTTTSAPSKADTLQKYTENYNSKTPSSTPNGSK